MISNCLLAAVAAWLRHPRTTRIRVVRNRARRRHVVWERDGQRYEFHVPGRSSKTYLQNALYRGEVRAIKSAGHNSAGADTA